MVNAAKWLHPSIQIKLITGDAGGRRRAVFNLKNCQHYFSFKMQDTRWRRLRNTFHAKCLFSASRPGCIRPSFFIVFIIHFTCFSGARNLGYTSMLFFIIFETFWVTFYNIFNFLMRLHGLVVNREA